ncbi:MAG TPA: hypothetical protein PLD27_04675 [bacterium]|nr:hypothetical protein [bacterium]HPQ18671.1 hypothetical protein [bacterium]
MKKFFFIIIIFFLSVILLLNILIKFLSLYLLNSFLAEQQYKKYNINFSFKDLSSSLFEPFKLLNIKIKNNENLLLIDEIKINVNLKNLITHNFNEIITSVIIKNPHLEINNYQTFKKLLDKLLLEEKSKKNLFDFVSKIYIENGTIRFDYYRLTLLTTTNISAILQKDNFKFRIKKSNVYFNEEFILLLKNYNLQLKDEIQSFLISTKFISLNYLDCNFINNSFSISAEYNSGRILLNGKLNNQIKCELINIPIYYNIYSCNISSEATYYFSEKQLTSKISLKNIFISFLPLPNFDINLIYKNNNFNVDIYSDYGKHNFNISYFDTLPVFHIIGRKVNLDFLKKDISGFLDYSLDLDLFRKDVIINFIVSAKQIKYSDYSINTDFLLNIKNNSFSFKTKKLLVNNQQYKINFSGQLNNKVYYLNNVSLNDYFIKNLTLSYDDTSVYFNNFLIKQYDFLYINELIYNYKKYSAFIDFNLYNKNNLKLNILYQGKNDVNIIYLNENLRNIFNNDVQFNVKYDNGLIIIKSIFSPFDFLINYNLSKNDVFLKINENQLFINFLTKIYDKKSFGKVEVNLEKQTNKFNLSSKILLTNINDINVFRVNIKTENEKIKIDEGILNYQNSVLFFSGNYDLIKDTLKIGLNLNQFVYKGNTITSNLTLLLTHFNNFNFSSLIDCEYLKFNNFEIDKLKFSLDYNNEKKIMKLTPIEKAKYTLNGKIILSDLYDIDCNIYNYDTEIIKCEGEVDFTNQKLNLKLFNNKNNISLLPLYLPIIKSTAGTGNINLFIKGKFNKPEILGIINFNNVGLKFNNYINEIQNLKGEIIFQEDSIVINKLTGKVNDNGILNINGSGTNIKNVKIKFTANNIKINYDKYKVNTEANINGELILTDTMPYLYANVEMFNGSLTYPPIYTSKSNGKKEKSYFDKIYLNIKLITKHNFAYTHQWAKIFFNDNSYLLIKGQTNNFLYSGYLTAFVGDVYYLNRKFTIQEASLKFIEGDYIPILNAYAKTNINDVVIELRYNGALEDKIEPQITSPTNPDLSFNELIQIIQIGTQSTTKTKTKTFPSENTTTFFERQETNIKSIVSLFNINLLNRFINPIKSNIEEQFDVNIDFNAPLFENIASRAINYDNYKNYNNYLFENTSFAIGKFLSKRLYVNYKGIFQSYENSIVKETYLYLKSEFEAKYYINKRATLQYIYKPELEVPQIKPEHFIMFQYSIRFK